MKCGGDGGDGRGEERMEGCEDGRKTVDEEFNVRLVRLFDTHTTIPLPLPPQTDPESGIRRRFIADRRIFLWTCGFFSYRVLFDSCSFSYSLFRFLYSIRNLKIGSLHVEYIASWNIGSVLIYFFI